MPHISKGGKYIFGWSIIRHDGSIFIPEETRIEYKLKEDERIIIISGSKTTKGIAVVKIEYIKNSEINNVLSDNLEFAENRKYEGKLIKYKGRKYVWTTINKDGTFLLPKSSMEELEIDAGTALLVIRGSNLGFVMGKQGPIIEKAKNHPEIPEFH